MTFQLTFADHAELRRTFDALAAKPCVSDDLLLQHVTEWASRLKPEAGYELGLLRDITALSDYFRRTAQDSQVASLARAAFAYLLQPPGKALSERLGLLDEAFICGLAVYQIRSELGEAAVYMPPAISASERATAEHLFMELLDAQHLSDLDLVTAARDAISRLAGFAECGLFQRMYRNEEFLAMILLDDSRSQEDRKYARAALTYLHLPDDAIHDSLGIVGLLDDNFVLQTAIDMIEPTRENWHDLLDEIIGQRPFLNHLVLDDGSGARPISEYMIVSSALSCPELHGAGLSKRMMLVSPANGPTAFVVALLSAIGRIYQHASPSNYEFVKGERIVIDGKTVAEFDGYSDDGARFWFKARASAKRAEVMRQSWLISQIGRLQPADPDARLKGKAIHTPRAEAKPALEWILGLDNVFALASGVGEIVLVMPIVQAQQFAEHWSLNGQRIRDCIPIGSYTPRKQAYWSAAPSISNLVTVIPDLDDACQYIEEKGTSCVEIIVDLEGANANKMAALKRLQRHSAMLLVVTSGNQEIANWPSDAGIWEWESDYLGKLLWPPDQVAQARGALSRYESSLLRIGKVKPEFQVIALPSAERAMEALELLARQRGSVQEQELNQALAFAGSTLWTLMRTPLPLHDTPSIRDKVRLNLDELNRLRSSPFVAEDISACIELVIEALEALSKDLMLVNPKYEVLAEQFAEAYCLCPERRICEASRTLLRGVVAGTGDVALQDHTGDVVIPGWFGVKRMSPLLSPPCGEKVSLLLYEPELAMYEGFNRAKDRRRLQRRLKQSMSVFGTLKRAEIMVQELEVLDEAGLEDVVEHARWANVASKLRARPGEDLVRARMVAFDDDSFALFTEFFPANCVTHLLTGAAIDERRARVQRKTPDKLAQGDVLLFFKGSAKDVIRVAADRLLNNEYIREIAALWREALTTYIAQSHVSILELTRLLTRKGCQVGQQAVRGWVESEYQIGPQNPDDVDRIAELTKYPPLCGSLKNVHRSISEVRGAHLRVSRRLARQVLAHAAGQLTDESVGLPKQVVLRRFASIDVEWISVPLSQVNQLLELSQ